MTATKTKPGPLKPADRINHERADAPTPHHRPHDWINRLLTEMPTSVLNATSRQLQHLHDAGRSLDQAGDLIPNLNDSRHVDLATARDTLDAYLASTLRVTPDATPNLEHQDLTGRTVLNQLTGQVDELGTCDARSLETDEHQAETPWGRATVRRVRCMNCGASTPTNWTIARPLQTDAKPASTLPQTIGHDLRTLAERATKTKNNKS